LEWADCDGEGGEILPKFESLIFEKNGSPFSFCESECPLYIASWVDLIQWLNILSTILYFAFLKMEYQRNMEVSLIIFSKKKKKKKKSKTNLFILFSFFLN